jgi:hypothetical protein
MLHTATPADAATGARRRGVPALLLSTPLLLPALLPKTQVRLLLEFCDRGTLADALAGRAFARPGGGRDMAGILATALDVARAMVFLHGHSVVHADLKVGEKGPRGCCPGWRPQGHGALGDCCVAPSFPPTLHPSTCNLRPPPSAVLIPSLDPPPARRATCCSSRRPTPGVSLQRWARL